ncbi:MAG: electron transfer flavoprotein subunit alpha/FixB family protein [Candidatus Marinimicrobia bacterium]|nr:electron transfer flavoprotein subunit alpha/FixB family protein [Candidatus Neomarinimicrobiota bacterium]MDP6936231.1 electron transfer flavoprotein subunit alpha/FixB family protein [Candidatus Neomarinimicrobiota bacterium]
MKILVFVQQEEGKINPVSIEAIAGAQQIASQCGGSLSAITFNASAAEAVTSYKVEEVLLTEDTALDTYSPLHFVKALQNIMEAESIDLLVLGHTYEARDWVPRLSARLDIPFISDSVGFKSENGLTLVRSIYQGKFNADVAVPEGKSIVSFQSGAFRADSIESGSSSVKKVPVELSDVSDNIRPGEKFQEAEQSVDLSQAEVIVSIGRGIGKEENLQIVKDLSGALGGELASSRPVVDAGWLESYRQVGSSGQSVTPKLYLALGISGAIQHVVGMKGSKNIVVINKDANAPIFEIADYGIVGDILEIIPKLTEKIQSA